MLRITLNMPLPMERRYPAGFKPDKITERAHLVGGGSELLGPTLITPRDNEPVAEAIANGVENVLEAGAKLGEAIRDKVRAALSRLNFPNRGI